MEELALWATVTVATIPFWGPALIATILDSIDKEN